MRTVRRILVAEKDPTTKSLPAVNKAIQLARAFGAKVELFHGIATPVYLDFDGLADNSLGKIERTRRAQCSSRLEAIAARARKHRVEVTTAVEWDYPPHEAIVRRAARIKADLIVAECHPGRHRVPWLLHLTDWELLRYSPAPVLLVKSKRLYRHPVVLSAVDPTHSFSKPTRLDDEILDFGATVKSALRGTLHVVHAYIPVPAQTASADLLTADMVERLDAAAKLRARTGLERVLRRVSIPRARQHLVGRHPIDAIPALARELGSAIVVMGAISRSGLKRVFIGNTAERILDALTCDVLVVKPRRFANAVARARRGVQIVTPQMLMPMPY
jgi:universal stress protein E